MTEKIDDLQRKLNQSILDLDNSIRQAVMKNDYRNLSINQVEEEEKEVNKDDGDYSND